MENKRERNGAFAPSQADRKADGAASAKPTVITGSEDATANRTPPGVYTGCLRGQRAVPGLPLCGFANCVQMNGERAAGMPRTMERLRTMAVASFNRLRLRVVSPVQS